MTEYSYQLTHKMDVTYGFCRGVNEICALLGLYVV